MARTKAKEEWIEVQEAAAILSEKSGRPIAADYVRLLSHHGKITRQAKDGRTNLYLKSDVESYMVDTKRGRKSSGAARTKSPESQQ